MRRRPFLGAGVIAVALAALTVATPATPAVSSGAGVRRAAATAPGPTAAVGPDVDAPLDCTNWRYGPADEPAPGVLPPEYDRSNYKRTSLRDPRPELARSPHHLCGQKGPAVDLAWGVTKGRDDVLIAVLDSGIKWRDADVMDDLATAAYVNPGEVTPPCGDALDCNGDGVFDIADFGAIADRNGNGLADPEDLLLDPARSDGVDDDGNGYVDDISGWDFLYGDNNPLDTVRYGHGSGEAEDSVAREGYGGDLGVCPRCRFLPVRVSDSFIADGGRFAAGVLFAVDAGAHVVQEALGTVSNPRQVQRAIDVAYRHGITVVASMADEASKHPNLPASLEHTMAVNSITARDDLLSGENSGWLALNGCTNFGGHTWVSVPSGACSSEATGQASGMVGLLESQARESGLRPYPHQAGSGPGSNRLGANEVMQVLRATADDIDFSTPNAVDPANDFGTPTGGLLDTVRYPTTPGWDATFGFGRVNTYEAVKAVRDGRIPPEADIGFPRWFSVLPTSGSLEVKGRVGANRARTYDYRVEWATGLQPPLHPARDVWHRAGGAEGLRHARNGVLGTIDLAEVAAALPDDGAGVPLGADGRPAEDRHAVRVRVVVQAHGGRGNGLHGIHQKSFFVHDDPDLMTGFPRRVYGSGTSQPSFTDIDGDGSNELVLATDSGVVHALRPNGEELPGWPVRGDVAPWWPVDSPAARAAHIRPVRGSIMVGAPLIADLDRDGRREVAVSDLSGRIFVWDREGRRVATMHTDAAFSTDSVDAQDEYHRTKPGFVGQPAAGDLDGDGDLELVAAALDRHVYAFHHDGTAVDGFPVLLVDPAKVAGVDPVSHRVTFTPGSGVREGGEIVAGVTLADVRSDARPEIIVGAQEQYAEPVNIGDGGSGLALLQSTSTLGNTRLYVIRPLGAAAPGPDTQPAHPHEQAYAPGWPARVPMIALEVLPTLGGGVATQAVVGDVHPSEGKEIVTASAAGPLMVLDRTGRSVYGRDADRDIPAAWSAGLGGERIARFGPQRTSDDLVASIVSFSGASLGDLNGDGRADITAPTGGLTRLLDVQASDLQLPSDDQLAAWSGATGNSLRGFPRATSDMAFFVTPAIADLDADGAPEAIAGNGYAMLDAYDFRGRAPAGWPKVTGGWLVGTPGVGDWDGDGRAEVAAVRRDGVLLVWHTDARGRDLVWPRSGGNRRNTGELG